MKLQMISDVHLEFRDNRYPHIPRKAPHIALLGDIGRPFSNVYKRFLQDLSRRFDTVLVIAGNHEYYSTSRKKVTVGEIRDQMKSVCATFANVHYLENSSIILEGRVRVLGATLWTNIPSDMWPTVRKSMNDYRTCFIDKYPDINVGVPMAPEHTTNWHETTVKWLKEELSAPGYRNVPTVVLTHHAPYSKGTSDKKFDNNNEQCCYSTDLSKMFAPPIVAWAYGHTHHPFDELVNGVRVLSNPLGYPGELPCEADALARPPIIEVLETDYDKIGQVKVSMESET